LDKYYDDGYDKQDPYYGAKVEDEKAKQPQQYEYNRNNEKQIK